MLGGACVPPMQRYAVQSVALVSPVTRRALAAVASCVIVLAAIGPAFAFTLAGDANVTAESPPLDHLLISELITGGSSASDEFVELYNPTAGPLLVDGLELVYVTATGATITRKAMWPAGTAPIPAGGHLLLANDAGIFSAIADARYANGLAAAGGSVALRAVGASTGLDAVGWGTAASTWLETRPAAAPAAGSSLERLPGGAAGSGQDTDDNLLDFVVSAIPDPQNSASPPISLTTPTPAPTATPDLTPEITPEATSTPTEPPADSPSPSATPTPFATPTPTPSPSPSPTPSPTLLPSPTPAPISIAAARAIADGATATVEGVSLTDGAFTDGGGYLFDGTAGIAIIVSDGTFPRGELLRVTGTLDDRYSQRTIRAVAADVVAIGTGVEPSPEVAVTGSLGEALEGRLVQVSGSVTSSISTLTGGIAFDLDDGSGLVRVVVGMDAGIDTASWERGTHLALLGVLGQRDSSGTGNAGYRLQPRDPLDVLSVEPLATPSPTPSSAPTPTPTPTPVVSATATPAPLVDLVTIAVARSMPTGVHLRIRGVVTLPSNLLDGATAVVQDPTAGILIRLGDTAGTLALGQLVELDGVRSTKSGMLSLRVSTPVLRLGTQPDPDPQRRATAALGEAQEASLVVVRGAVATAILRSSAGTVSFSLDDGSGPIRITVAPKSGISLAGVTRGAWLELRGVLGQETTGREADKGYRIWPRRAADVTLLATVAAGSSPKPSPHAVSSGQLPALTGAEGSSTASVTGSPGAVPLVALALPTRSPDAAAITGSAAPHGADEHRPQAAALLGVSLGMAMLAGLLGLRGRRRGVEEASEDGGELPGSPAAVGEEPFPHLALMPIAVADAPEERRILPPT